MNCHKCEKEMTMTPVCIHCGDIPIAEASFKALEDKIKLYEEVLTQMIRFRGEMYKPSPDWFIDLAKRTLDKVK
jgi:hypothetical protein